MALSGTLTASGGYKGRTLVFSWTATQSVEDNTSTISWSLKGTGGNSGYSYALKNASVIIDGETVYNQPPKKIMLGGYTLVASGKKVIQHTKEGTRSFSVSIQGSILNDEQINTTGNSTYQLNPIPRKAKITSAPNFYDTSNPEITYLNPEGVNASLELGIISSKNSTILVSYRTISNKQSQYIFHFTQSELNNFYKQIPNSNSLKVKFCLRTTINGIQYLDYAERNFSIENGFPILTPTVTDINSITTNLTGNNKTLISGFSEIQCKFNVSAIKGSTIISKQLKNGDLRLSDDGILTNSKASDFIFTATDSRNNTKQETITPTIIKYYTPSCSIGQSCPITHGQFILNVNGKCFKGSFGRQNNSLTVQYRIKNDADSSWGGWTNVTTPVWNSNGDFTSQTTINNLDYKTTYVYQVKVTDALSTTLTDERKVQTSPIFDWGKNDVIFNVPVRFNGGIEGVEIGKWTPKSTKINETEAYGNYFKIGNMVTITWYITGKSNDGSQFTITGLPFPADSNYGVQAGGGVLINCTTKANQTFIGYSIEGGDTIYARSGATSSSEGARESSYCGTKYQKILTSSGSITYRCV